MKHSSKNFDVIVVGGGHAGTEAAHAAARAGRQILLITHRFDRIGEMSCNPAIGGLGKGHLVREIDALDGLMGRVADRAGIQFRLLNRRKGAAVRGPRAQCDRGLYRQHMQHEIAATENLTVLEGEVTDLLMQGETVGGVVIQDGTQIPAKAVVLTTGTFLRGVIHIGQEQRPGGRIGDPASNRLGERLTSADLPLGRLKTGTPPRIDARSIDFTILDEQPGDGDPHLFSYLSKAVEAPQVSCFITTTNEKTHEIIRENIGKSAMYSGNITGVGPRYCPSIEDKVMRFADKTSHQIFLEPETAEGLVIYPNGISTSLPADVQEAYVRSIKGMENARIDQIGYAIEYDYIDPRALKPSLEVRNLPGLFLAGQINGTTGYEEAGAQGLIAGVNAALLGDREPMIPDRASSYIGVMIDDLTVHGVTEPYRMFTSRAEFRLMLRADNADQRLTPLGESFGLISDKRRDAFHCKMDAYGKAKEAFDAIEVTPRQAAEKGLPVKQDGARRTAYELIGNKDIGLQEVLAAFPELGEFGAETLDQLLIDASYAVYVERQRRDVELVREEEGRVLPEDLDFGAIEGLSNEIREKLMRACPRTLGQARRVEGVTPAALALILAAVRRGEKARRKGLSA